MLQDKTRGLSTKFRKEIGVNINNQGAKCLAQRKKSDLRVQIEESFLQEHITRVCPDTRKKRGR